MAAQLFDENGQHDAVDEIYEQHRTGRQMLAPFVQAAEAVDGGARGLKTGGKAVVNGTATAIVNTVTLGLNDAQMEILKVTAEDRAGGYGTAMAFATAGGEILIGVGTAGAAAALSKGGKLMQLGSGALAVIDAAGNVVGVVKGSLSAIKDGLTVSNGLQIVGSGLGLAGNAAAMKSAGNAGAGTVGEAAEQVENLTKQARKTANDVAPNRVSIRNPFNSLEEFKALSGFVFKSEKEAAKAFEVYTNASNARKGIVIGHGMDPINEAYDGWQAFRMVADDWSYEINMSWIDGAVDAGKTVYIATPIDKIVAGSTTWQEMLRVISRGGKVVFAR